MEAKTNYTFVGTMVILLVTGLIITSLWLSIGFDNKTYNSYGVYMQEAVSGLTEDSLVKYNGVVVGYIDKISLNKNNPQEVLLTLKITTATPITISTEATLINQGITGNTYLGLNAASSSLIQLQKKAGEPYPIIPYKPSLMNQLENMLKDINDSLNRILTPQNEENFSKILKHLETVSHALADNEGQIAKTLNELPQLIHVFEATLTNFSNMAGDVSFAGKQVSSTMQAGKRSVDTITQLALPQAVDLLRRLDNTARNLEQISQAMRNNPSVIIRGSTPPPLGPGE